MTSKQMILDTIHRHQQGTKGIVFAVYDDCIDVVTQTPDRELALSREIADLRETVSELEGLLEEARNAGR